MGHMGCKDTTSVTFDDALRGRRDMGQSFGQGLYEQAHNLLAQRCPPGTPAGDDLATAQEQWEAVRPKVQMANMAVGVGAGVLLGWALTRGTLAPFVGGAVGAAWTHFIGGLPVLGVHITRVVSGGAFDRYNEAAVACVQGGA